MSSGFPQLRGQRSCGHDGPDPWHHQGDCRQHASRQLSEACGRRRIFKVYAGSRVHLIGKGPRVGMALRDDRNVFLADTERMKCRRGLGGLGRI